MQWNDKEWCDSGDMGGAPTAGWTSAGRVSHATAQQRALENQKKKKKKKERKKERKKENHLRGVGSCPGGPEVISLCRRYLGRCRWSLAHPTNTVLDAETCER